MYVQIDQLPVALRNALKSVGYGKADVSVTTAETVTAQSYGASGCRDFLCIVNLATGEFKTVYGSWGGPNAYTSNIIDSDATAHALDANICAIQGREGGSQPVSATVKIHPSNVAALLPQAPEVSETERAVLRTFGYTSAYRKEALRSIKNSQAAIESLIEKGMIKRNKAGALSITTSGKNAKGK